MKDIIEKQLKEWRGELAIQKQKQAQVKKTLDIINADILMIEGGLQAKELLLKKIVSADQPTGIVELGQEQEKAPLKK